MAVEYYEGSEEPAEAQPMYSNADPLADPAAYAERVAASLTAYMASPAGSEALIWRRETDTMTKRTGYGSSARTRYEYLTRFVTDLDWGQVAISRTKGDYGSTFDVRVLTHDKAVLGEISSSDAGSVCYSVFERVEAAWTAQQTRAARGILSELGGL